MSGGRFEYNQYKIRDIWETIQSHLDRQGAVKPPDEQWSGFDTYPTETPEIQEKMIDAIEVLKKAEVYAQRIDWYLSGDDGEETFLRRLKEDLDKL